MATIVKRGNSYRIRCYDGYDSNGKQIERCMTWTPEPGMSEAKIKKEVKKQAEIFEINVKNGLYSVRRMKFSEYAALWFAEYAEVNLKPKTVSDFRDLLPRVNDNIGHLYLDKIRPSHLIKMRDNLMQTRIVPTYRARNPRLLRDKCKQQSRTLKAFAADAQLNLGVIKYAISGKNITLHSATQIAKALNTNVSMLFLENETDTLDANTVKHYLRLTSTILSTAVEQQYILENPMERVKMPRTQEKEVCCLTREEALELLTSIQDEPPKYRTAITVLLYTGMRREEILALKWKDVDFTYNIINIHASIQYIPHKGLIYGEPKTKSSRRIIKVSNVAMQALSEYRDYQMQQYKQLGMEFNPNCFIFEGYDGVLMRPNTLTHRFHKIVKEHDLPPVHLHSLRHTMATLLIDQSLPLTAITASLGHSSPHTTALIYAHALRQNAAKAAEAMDLILQKQLIDLSTFTGFVRVLLFWQEMK